MISLVRSHVVIRRSSYVAGTQRPEVGVFTQVHGGRTPWGRIDVGEMAIGTRRIR